MIENNDEVKVIKMGAFVEVKKSNINQNKPKMQRISTSNYFNKETGEFFEFSEEAFSKDKKRTYNVQSLNNTRNNIKEIILSNYVSNKHTMLLTLLYDEYVTEVKQFDKHFNSFMKQVRRKYPEQDINYVTSVEYHANGKLHAHVLLYWKDEYSPTDVTNICSYWKQGDCKHFPIRNNQDILYVCSYLINSCSYIEDPQKYGFTAISEKPKEKQSIKNERLSVFNAYARFFRHSKGMKTGEVKTVKYEEIIDIKTQAKKIYHGTVDKKIVERNVLHIKQEYEYYMTDENRR